MEKTKEKYQQRLERVMDAVALKEPDRVPCIPFTQTYPFLHAGYTMAEILYDAEKAKDGLRRYVLEYEPDMVNGYGTVFAGQGPMMEKMGVKWMQWAGQPGSNIDKNSIHQYIEKPYLRDDEYEEILTDFSGWITRKWYPRSFTLLEPFGGIDFRSTLGYGYAAGMIQFTNPDLHQALKVMAEVGEMAAKWYQESGEFEQELDSMGFPVMTGATTTTAFDRVSDNFRGTIGTMLDIYEQPENLKAAIEMFYPSTLEGALSQMKRAVGKLVFIPLHKGMDGFLSPQQYDEFYWDTLYRLIMGLIDQGCIPYVYTEGKYSSRLERLADVPRGKVIYHFEDVDMAEAKRIVGRQACITGGFNTRLLETGTREQVVEGIKRLLDICAPGGGYIFDINDTMDNCKPENVEAMFETVKEYGKY